MSRGFDINFQILGYSELGSILRLEIFEMFQKLLNNFFSRAIMIPGNITISALTILSLLAGVAANAATPGRVFNSIDVTDDQIILVELRESNTDSNLFDLENTTISFTPDGEEGYSVERKELQWNEDVGEEMEISALGTDYSVMAGSYTIKNFTFPFSGGDYGEIYVSPSGMITFSEKHYSNIIQRMARSEFRYDTGINQLSRSFFENTIAPLFWTHYYTSVPGAIHIYEGADYIALTFSVSEPCCHLDAPISEINTNEYQVKLWSSGQVDFSYKEIESGMGIVGVFPEHIYEQGQLIKSFEFEESSELAPEYDITNVSVYKTKDNRNLEFVYTFAGDLSAVHTTDFPNWYVAIEIRTQNFNFGGGLISGNAPILREFGFDEMVSAPVIRGNQLFIVLNLAKPWTGSLIEIASRVQENAGLDGDKIRFSFNYPILVARETQTRNTDFSTEEISGLQSRIYEAFYHQAYINTDWAMCDIIAELGDVFTIAAHYSGVRFDSNAASSPVRSFDSPSKAIGIGLGFGARPRDGPGRVGICNTYDLQANLARYIPLGSVSGSSFGSTPYYYSSGLLVHEVGHNWIVSGLPALVEEETVGLSSFGGHWRNELHSPVPINLTGGLESSTMGGFNWQANDDGTFSRINSRLLESGFSYLDLYLMGLIPPENVPEFFIVNDSEYHGNDNNGNGIFTIDKVDIAIEDVIAVNGPRFPTYLDSSKDFNMAFTYLRPYGESVDQGKLDTLRGIRDAFFDRWCAVTGGLSQAYSQATSRYQSPNSCELSTDFGIGTEDPTYGVSYDWPDLSLSDFATVNRGHISLADWNLTEGETFTSWFELEGAGVVDIYVRFLLPGDSWITLGSDGSLSEPLEIIPFRQSFVLESGVTNRIDILELWLGTGATYNALQKGDYVIIVTVAYEGQTKPFHKFVNAWSNRFRIN